MDRGSALGGMTKTLDSLRASLAKMAAPGTFSFQRLVPITKVDDERREVSGVATSEDVDASNELLEYAGSKVAFSEWRGNLREMHSAVAVGRAVEVVADDTSRRILVRARISRGAPDTWEKVKDGTLRYFSVGGQRVRSEVGADGIRRTSQWNMTELSLVDSGANPACQFDLVKMSGGVPTATALLGGEMNVPATIALAVKSALDAEMNKIAKAFGGSSFRAVSTAGNRDGDEDSHLVLLLDKCATPLEAGCRPFAWDVAAAFKAAGAPYMRCDKISSRDWTVLGPALAKELRTLSKGISAEDITDRENVRAAIVATLAKMVTQNDLRKSGEQLRSAASERHEEVRKASGPPTESELIALRDKLREQLRKANEERMPQQSREYRELSDSYFRINERVKAMGR